MFGAFLPYIDAPSFFNRFYNHQEVTFMEYRNEWKYLVTGSDLAILRAHLNVVLRPDAHQTGAVYCIRSLYFDDARDSALRENEDGVDARRKFRIRIYNGDASHMNLEIKEKLHGYTKKTGCPLTREQADRILAGLPPRIEAGTPAPLNLLAVEMQLHRLRPVVIVDYERTAYVGKLGNVRITLDQNIAGSADVGQFFDPRPALHPILPPGQHVLEVKFDEFLPAPIADVLELGEMQRISFSKYTLCREALGPGVKGTLYEHQGRNQEIRFAGIH